MNRSWSYKAPNTCPLPSKVLPLSLIRRIVAGVPERIFFRSVSFASWNRWQSIDDTILWKMWVCSFSQDSPFLYWQLWPPNLWGRCTVDRYDIFAKMFITSSICQLLTFAHIITSSNSDWDFTCFKRFNNCYIFLLNSPQTLENTGFVTGELSLIFSLVLYRPISVYELW